MKFELYIEVENSDLGNAKKRWPLNKGQIEYIQFGRYVSLLSCGKLVSSLLDPDTSYHYH